MNPVHRRRLTRGGIALLLVTLVASAGVAGFRAWQDSNRSDLERALALTPASAERFAWTDWAAVRRAAGPASAGDDPMTHLLDRGFDLDLTSTTAMGVSAELLDDEFGFSPLTVEWELLAQSQEGSVLLLGMPEGADIGGIEATWEGLGFQRPDDPDDIWEGGDSLLATIAAGRAVSPQFAQLAIDADRRIVMASDQRDFLRTTVESLDADAGGDEVAEAAAASGSALSGVLLGGDLACSSLAMSAADDVDQATADELIARAGPVNPVTGWAITAQPDGEVLVAMSFENSDQARENADTRAALAAGPAPGQGGDFADRFSLGAVTAQGSVVTMELEPVEGAYVLSDLSAGPVLFATC